jgi:hypothetical protein
MKDRYASFASRYERFAQWLWYDLRPLWLPLVAALWFWLALTHC